jgi:hypothetical protein
VPQYEFNVIDRHDVGQAANMLNPASPTSDQTGGADEKRSYLADGGWPPLRVFGVKGVW